MILSFFSVMIATKALEAKGKAKIVEKSWGREIWMANNESEDYCGKILEINAGSNTSLHFHANKHETLYILSGQLRIDIVDTETTAVSSILLNKEETFSIDRCVPHKLIAEKNPVTFVEISTFHEDSDSYRVSK